MAEQQVSTGQNAPIMPPPRAGGSKLLVFGGEAEPGGHRVSLKKQLLLGKEPFLPILEVPLKSSEEVELEGSGFDVYQRVGFALSENGPSFNVAYADLLSNDSFLRFKVPDLENSVKDGGVVWLKLLAKDDYRSANITIGPHALYSASDQQEKDQQDKAKKAQQTAEEWEKEQQSHTNLVSEALLNPTLGGIANAVQQGLAGGQQGQKQATGAMATPGSSPTKVSNPSDRPARAAGEQADDDADEESQTGAESQSASQPGATTVLPENFRQAAELVGEYLDKNPGLIANIEGGVKAEIMAALAAGDIGSLSPEAQTVLKQVLSSNIFAATNQAAAVQSVQNTQQLQQAVRIVGGQLSATSAAVASNSTSASSTSSTAQASVTANAATTTAAAGSATVSVTGSTTTQATAKVTGQTQAAGQAEAKITAEVQAEQKSTPDTTPTSGTSASGGAAVQGQVSGQAGLSTTRSMEAAGEYLDKNPGLIANTKDGVKGEIMAALSSGQPQNLNRLSPEAKLTLQSVLKILEGNPTVPQQVANSAKNINQQLEARPEAGAASRPEAVQIDNAAQEQPAQNASKASSGQQQQTAQGGRAQARSNESGSSQTSKQKESQPVSLPGKGAVDGIGGKSKQPALEAQSREKSGSVLAQPPAGLQGLLRNRANFENKLSLARQGDAVMKAKAKPNSESGLRLSNNSQGQQPEDANRPNAEEENPSNKNQGQLNKPESIPQPLNAGSLPQQGNDGSEPQPDADNKQQPGEPSPQEDSAEPDEQAERQEEQEDQDEAVSAEQSQTTGRTSKAAKKNEALEEVTELVNKEVNAYLNSAAWWVWGLALETFGVSVIIGAVLGDLIGFFKDWLVRRSIGIISVASLGQGINISEFSEEEIAEKIKIGGKVKIHIFLMHLVPVTIIILFFLFVFVIGCNYPFSGKGSVIEISTNFSGVCSPVNLPGPAPSNTRAAASQSTLSGH